MCVRISLTNDGRLAIAPTREWNDPRLIVGRKSSTRATRDDNATPSDSKVADIDPLSELQASIVLITSS